MYHELLFNCYVSHLRPERIVVYSLFQFRIQLLKLQVLYIFESAP
jgi:hypothetical protein